MNFDVRNEATNLPVSLKNEATPDAAVFPRATPAPNSGAATAAASAIVPDAHIAPLEQK